VVGFTTGSRGNVPGKPRKEQNPVIREIIITINRSIIHFYFLIEKYLEPRVAQSV
jgi:hypothetical protein